MTVSIGILSALDEALRRKPYLGKHGASTCFGKLAELLALQYSCPEALPADKELVPELKRLAFRLGRVDPRGVTASEVMETTGLCWWLLGLDEP